MIQINSPAVHRPSPHFRRPCVTIPFDEGNRPHRRPRIHDSTSKKGVLPDTMYTLAICLLLGTRTVFPCDCPGNLPGFSFFALDLLVGNMRGCDLVVSLQSPPHIVSSSWRIYIALYAIAVVMAGTAPKHLKQLTTVTYSFHSASQVH
jgi:hypothetical protein